MHTLLPVAENLFEFNVIRCCQRPFFATGVVHFQVVKIEGHRQLFTTFRRILLAMFQCGGRHFTHGHQAAWLEYVMAHLLQKLMNARPVGIETAAVTLVIGGEILLLGDQVDHIEAKTIDALIGPELAHFLQFFTYRRVLPVKICLLGREQVQIILALSACHCQALPPNLERQLFGGVSPSPSRQT